MDDLLRESEKHKRQMSHNQKVILGSMTEIGTLGENTEQSPGHIITIDYRAHVGGLYLSLIFHFWGKALCKFFALALF